ncbi:c-type cytochrome biogenesis protein CcsB [Thiomicrospira sp. WB1]|jgi:cytochrome c-type biogenesis protein CcsB|uniref:c-type cytochrome biogenesis protein CcsB n=1 Tax=Thiomicrospira sp. WB1 TaxID=1685380 RepID=UPI00074A7615|nr:c-type cytochrome biogenesis protein CcsB [Thiomicrospira sp. WB1]KUJ72290.1 cytochrome C biogenesis protein [Thiomicrospira sp. WB1]
MSTANASLEMKTERQPWGLRDTIWTALILLGSYFAWDVFGSLMDVYEIGILIGFAAFWIWFGRFWPSIQPYSYATAVLSLLAIWIYIQNGNVYEANETAFFLKYLISSQSAIMWMSALFVIATAAYFGGLFAKSESINQFASFLAWAGAVMGTVGMMVRWHESYLINPDYGHIPVSSLYEVFILFAVMTTLIYLFYEQKMRTRAMGGFVMLIVSASVAFLLWYTFDRGAHEIQPLVPALKSYWMKIHVPANFVGYGAFSIAAMVGIAYLIVAKLKESNSQASFVQRMPSLESMDDLMYKTIALGFAWFTIATVLGAMWAAEAWGGYWSWDPKETWALIVWLNYAAWLHIRMSKGWRGKPMAWWAVIGLFITTFAFLGVNMFLSGLHSYGEL